MKRIEKSIDKLTKALEKLEKKQAGKKAPAKKAPAKKRPLHPLPQIMGKRVKAKEHERECEDELRLLQIELVKLQRQIIAGNLRLLVILEGRDTAGKDGYY